MNDNGICIKEGGTTNAPSMRYCSLPLSFNAMLAVCVGLCGCPFRFLLFYFFVGGKSLNHSLLITIFAIVIVYTKHYRIFVV